MKIPVSDIIIESDFREDRVDIGDLALSIMNNGLLSPIILTNAVDGKYQVIAGRRRFIALRDYINLEELEENEHFVFRDKVDPLVVQFEENFRRLDFTPIETARLVSAIHKKYVDIHGEAVKGIKGKGWSMDDTGRLLSKDKSFVSRMLLFLRHEEDIKNCTNIRDAITTIEKMRSKNITDIIQKTRVEKALEEKITGKIEDYISNLYLGDALDFLPTVKKESVDFILTDPPFAINYDEIAGGESFTTYDDDPEEILKLIDSCMSHYYRILKKNRFIVVWVAFEHMNTILDMMDTAGFYTSATPLVWVKLNASGRSSNPDKNLGSACEIAIYGWKGTKAELVTKGRGNVFPYDTVRKNRIHIAQKPESLLCDILNIFSNPGDTVVDTFVGSGSTLRSCFLADRFFRGCEKLEVNYNSTIVYTRDWAKTINK
ncbi:MAG TPA: DNA methyltransferase [Clostridia bacterium]|nr:DNA methyltransferase [Clostridia bacterium]